MELPTLTSPERLWWLAAAVFVLWRLAQPPRPRAALATAHPAQWRLAQERLRRRPQRFRALRWLLLCLACAMLGLAAAGPVDAGSRAARRVTFLVDGSASMGARDASGRTAFARAIERARELAQRAPKHLEVEAVVLRGGSIERRRGDSARSLVDVGEPSGSLPAPLADLAAALEREDSLVWSLGDGQSGDGAAPLVGAWTPIVSAARNVALLDPQVDRDAPRNRLRVRALLASFADEPLRVSLRVEGATAGEDREAELGARKSMPVEWDLERRPEGGTVRIVVAAPADVLSGDDAFEILVPPQPRARIAVQAEESAAPFAAAAGKALAESVGGSLVEAAPGASVGFLIVEGGLGELPSDPGPMVSFGRSRAGALPWPSPLVVDWDRSEPMFDGLDLSELEIAHALTGSLPTGKTLMTGQLPDGSLAPLAVAVDGPRGRAVHFAFRLQDSSLGLLAAFPQMLLRCHESSQPGRGVVETRRGDVPSSESDLQFAAAVAERTLDLEVDPPRNHAAWLVLAALALLAVRSGVR